jgi:hypothetical protein
MPVPYDYDAERGIVHARPRGELRLNDIGERFERVAADDTIRPGVVEYIHFDGITEILYDSQGSSVIPELYRPLREKKRIRATVFIAASDFHFGVARMVQIWFDIQGLGDSVVVVRSEAEADEFYDSLA